LAERPQKQIIINTEAKYIKSLKADNQQAMSDLYDRYAGPLYGVIARICTDEAAAKDALQDTFVKVWTSRHSYDEDKAKLFTWMYTIARRTALDHLRRSTTHNTTGTKDLENSVAQSVRANLDTMDVHDKVHRLDAKYRDVLYALFFNGYTQREWSKESGLPLGTVKSRLRIGIRQLRHLYLDHVFLFYLILQSL